LYGSFHAVISAKKKSHMSASKFIITIVIAITEMPEFDSRYSGDLFFTSMPSNTTANQVTPAERVWVLMKNRT
jgi:hypothetical protein